MRRSGRYLYPVEITASLDRSFRGIEGGFLAVILFLLFYYSIPISRNLKGIIAGYSLYVAASIADLTVRTFLRTEIALAPWAYSLSLVIWMLALWRYDPIPRYHSSGEREGDSAAAASAALRAISETREYLSKVARP